MLTIYATIQAMLLLGVSSEATSFPRRLTIPVVMAEGGEVQITLLRNGRARCEWGWLRVKLYDIALYLQNPSRDPKTIIASEQVKRFELVFLRKLSQRQMVRAYEAAFKANTGKEQSGFQKQIEAFCAQVPAVQRGDRLVFTITPTRGLTLEHNGKTLGSFAGKRFSALFVKLYVGSHPPTTAVKQGLLGVTAKN